MYTSQHQCLKHSKIKLVLNITYIDCASHLTTSWMCTKITFKYLEINWDKLNNNNTIIMYIYSVRLHQNYIVTKQQTESDLVNGIFFKQNLEAERLKGNAIADKVLAHRLHPVKTKRVQHGTGTLHDTKNSHSTEKPKIESTDNHDYT